MPITAHFIPSRAPLVLFSAVVVSILMVAGCVSPDSKPAGIAVPGDLRAIIVVGHRGAAGLAPENTLAAFTTALDMGVDGLEMDVLFSADGEVVVHHDFILNPATTRDRDGRWLAETDRRPVRELTLAELKTYDVGRLNPNSRYAYRYPDQHPEDNERIPTLKEVAGLLKSRKDTEAELWIEIKTNPEKPELTPAPETIVEAVAALVKEQDLLDRVRFLAFDWQVLVHSLEHHPQIPVVFLSYAGRNLDNLKAGRPGASEWLAGVDVDDFNGSVPRAIRSLGGRLWGPDFRSLTADQVREAHQLGIRVFPWTPDNAADMRRLLEMEVDGIITNRPDRLSRLLRNG
jgi:glycerophosphoryl diester phosphodiesterase